jgi:hypothetical protein
MTTAVERLRARKLATSMPDLAARIRAERAKRCLGP